MSAAAVISVVFAALLFGRLTIAAALMAIRIGWWILRACVLPLLAVALALVFIASEAIAMVVRKLWSTRRAFPAKAQTVEVLVGPTPTAIEFKDSLSVPMRSAADATPPLVIAYPEPALHPIEPVRAPIPPSGASEQSAALQLTPYLLKPHQRALLNQDPLLRLGRHLARQEAIRQLVARASARRLLDTPP